MSKKTEIARKYGKGKKEEPMEPVSSYEMETVASSSFPPIWKPKDKGEMIIFSPLTFRKIDLKRGKKIQTSWCLDCLIKETNSENFYLGSGKNQTQQEIHPGDTISLPLSAALVGDDPMRLAQMVKGKPIVSVLLKVAQQENVPLGVVYQETVGIGGGQEVKRFITQAPKGLRDKLLKTATKA